ncbi:HAMP domain-containing sensor histidine kinase, partial [uncultured Akkermansia sp.]
LQNACDALKIENTPNPSIHVECRVEKISSKDQTSHTTREILVSVTDNGPGVPKDLHEKIFRPNFTTKKKGLSFGLGLGLTIVRRIVDSYGGRIRLESVPGHTVFTIIIPTINNYGKN